MRKSSSEELNAKSKKARFRLAHRRWESCTEISQERLYGVSIQLGFSASLSLGHSPQDPSARAFPMAEWELATGVGTERNISALHCVALRVGTAQSVKCFSCNVRTEFDPPEPILKVRGSDVSCNPRPGKQRQDGPWGQLASLSC